MSIFTGLIRQVELVSSNCNLINSSSIKTDTSIRVSTIFKTDYGYYSRRSNQKSGASYPQNTENVYLNFKPDYIYSINCLDSVTGNIISPNELNFHIISINGDYNYSVNKNNTSYNIVFNNIPNNKTIQATIRITGSNYLETFTQIISDPSVTSHVQEVRIVNINNIPEGVGITSNTLSQNENGTVQEYNIVVPSSESKYETASFSIPSGTQFFDKDGNKLVGDINVRIAHFSPTNPNAVNLFNTGWYIGSIIIDGKKIPEDETIEFITGGFFTIEIEDSSGKLAENIGQTNNKIKCQTSVNPELINPETEQPLVEGDTIPYWRINKDGIWEQHGIATAITVDGNLILEVEVSSFSMSNLDWPSTCSITDLGLGYTGMNRQVYADVTPMGVTLRWSPTSIPPPRPTR